jgi:hypothetical protein
MDKSTIGNLYGTTEDRINTMSAVGQEDTKSVWRVFKAMRSMELDKVGTENQVVIDHMRDNYGIQLHWVDTAGARGWAMRFDIVNPELYTLFLLKYS